MKTERQKRNVNFGLIHSKQYKPSVISPFLIDKDDDGNIIKVHSDIYIILREKDIQKHIAVDQLRNFIDQLTVERKVQPHNYTDEQLFSMITPKSINTITDAYQYSRYLKSRENEIVAKAKEYQEFAKKYNSSYRNNKEDVKSKTD